MQRTEILFGYGAMHLMENRTKFATNIKVRCTILEPINPAFQG